MSVLLFTATLAAAIQAAPVPPATPAAATPPAKEKKICRRVTGTSSRLDVTRTCMTAAQWDVHDRAVGDALTKDLSKSRGVMGSR